MNLQSIALAASLVLSSALHAEIAPVPLKEDDRIVFLGDSITAGGKGSKGYITLLTKAIEDAHPDLGIETIGAGVSGNKVLNLQKRLEKDVLAEEPTIVFNYIGINDVWHWKRKAGTSKADFKSGLEKIVSKIKASGARVILCTPSVIGEKLDGANEYDTMLNEYAAISRQVAKDSDSQLVDLRKAFLDHLKANNPRDKAKGILTGDGVHLNAEGNKLVAREMGQAIGIRVE